MSKKTMKQRIAVVAVSALTAGLFSVVSTPVANAGAPTAADFGSVTTAASDNFGILSVTGKVSEMLTTGALKIKTLVADVDTGASGDIIRLKITSGSGTFSFATSAGDAVAQSASTATDGQSVSFTSSNATNDSGDAGGTHAVYRPTAAGKVIIQYQSVTVAGAVTVVDTLTVLATLTAAGAVSGVLSVGDSLLAKVATGTAATSNVDNATSNLANGSIGYIGLDLRDAVGGDVPVGAIVVTATNGALVAYGADPSATSTSTAVAADAGTSDYVSVAQGTANIAVTTLVTVTYNGTVVGTRTFTITGDLARIVVGTTTATGLAVNPKAATTATGFLAFTYDAAGNQIGYAVAVDATKYTTQVTAVTVTTPTTTASTGVAGGWTCADASGSSTVRIKGSTVNGVTVNSNDFTAACGGSVSTYTAALDKAVYAPGDIATLTINAKDSKAFMVGDARTVGANVAIAGSNLTAVTAAAPGDTFAQGVKTYKFVVGSTEGSYQLTVDLPAYVATDAAKAVSYSIKSSTTAVSNADVLKSIVALIASINKQIQALQKLILARR